MLFFWLRFPDSTLNLSCNITQWVLRVSYIVGRIVSVFAGITTLPDKEYD